MIFNKYTNLLPDGKKFIRLDDIDDLNYILIEKNLQNKEPLFVFIFSEKNSHHNRLVIKNSESLIEIFDQEVLKKLAAFHDAIFLENGNIDIRIRYYDGNKAPMGWDKQKIIDPKTGIVLKEGTAWPG